MNVMYHASCLQRPTLASETTLLLITACQDKKAEVRDSHLSSSVQERLLGDWCLRGQRCIQLQSDIIRSAVRRTTQS